ncbi:MAG: hypothetical protein IJA88_06510 [Clostridia bacterium]|nr:hypothetical protein [Clostridia bacterium]
MKSVDKYKAFYNLVPDSPIIMKEFGYLCLDRWIKEGHIKEDTNLKELFGFDDHPFELFNLGWCEADFCPFFKEEVIEDRGEYEVVRDYVGRHVLCFKGRRSGFMPEYIDHPVKDMKTWMDNVEWRMNPNSPERYINIDELLGKAAKAKAEGRIITQRLVGGYMYLRSLMGPEELLYMFYDDPELIHACMRKWLELADGVIARHQRGVELDEVFIGEDICYNVSSLISHDMIKEFLFPYYQQLIKNIKSRQKKQDIILQVDTDGHVESVLELYKSIGFNYFSPMEVASGCDVVEIRKKHPDILILGGFDKRILAQGKQAIDREIDRIMPFMKKHGGFIPTCDHSVPEEVDFEDYVHFRKRLLEFSK